MDASSLSFKQTPSAHYNYLTIVKCGLIVSGFVLGSGLISGGTAAFFIFTPTQFTYPVLFYATYITGITAGTVIVLSAGGGTLLLIIPKTHKNPSFILPDYLGNNGEKPFFQDIDEFDDPVISFKLPTIVDSKFLIELLEITMGKVSAKKHAYYDSLSGMGLIDTHVLEPIFDEFENFLIALQSNTIDNSKKNSFLNITQESYHSYRFEIIGSTKEESWSGKQVSHIGSTKTIITPVPFDIVKLLLIGFAFKAYPNILLGYGQPNSSDDANRMAYLYVMGLVEAESGQTITIHKANGVKMTLYDDGRYILS